jgi:hypothetical protein
VSEVKDQPIPDALWFRPSSCTVVALELLFERLNWPVPMVRWRAAREIRDLLSDGISRPEATAQLLHRLDSCQTESEVAAWLTVVLLTEPAARPSLSDVTSRLHRPSALSDALMHQIYATPLDPQTWCGAHSGQAPDDFEPDKYFDQHKTAHVPPILANNLRGLEARTRKPFMRQWAFEWKQLRDRLGTKFTIYPHYFDEVSEVRSGIVGQYLQRQNEVYRSAYLRAFAFAVDQWGMPAKMAQGYCFDNIPAIGGLFELNPGQRPVWLTDIPERLLAADADFQNCAEELVKAGKIGADTMVSLHTPFRKDAAAYGHLSAAAFFVTDDFQLDDHTAPFEPPAFIPLSDRFDLRGRKTSLTADEKGSEGDALPVCATLLPLPFGYWQGEYFSVGLSVPANYCLPDDAFIQCSPSALQLTSGDSPVSSTQVWHDDWSPRYPRGGHTRCGVVTLMDAKQLSKAQSELDLHLVWFVERRVWKRESDYGDYKLITRTAIVSET